MRRPPRNPQERLFSLETVGFALLQGLSVLAVCLGVFLIARQNHAPDAARALTFTTLVVAFLAIILANRSWVRTIVGSLRVPNTALWWVLGGTTAFLSLVLLVPVVQRTFHFAPLHAADVAVSAGAGLMCVMWFDLLKLGRRLTRAGRLEPQEENDR
jgi:Ca2+-transporting ATPase